MQIFAVGGTGRVGALGGGCCRASWDAGGVPDLNPPVGFWDLRLAVWRVEIAGVLGGCPT